MKLRLLQSWILAGLLAAGGATVRGALTATELQVKAAFIFHFTQFIDWPPQTLTEPEKPFVIGILGDEPMDEALAAMVRGERFAGHPLAVRRLHSPSEAGGCQILYVSRDAEDLFRDARLREAAVLTVGETERFLESGGMIEFYTEHNHVRLRINLAAARGASLTISSKLLRVAQVLPLFLMPHHPLARGAAALALALAVLAPDAAAQTSVPIDTLKQLSVEDLMNLEVTSVSKEPEKLMDAPSAIQVITSDDIQRSGAYSIPQALRLADNLEVAQKDANDWAISARGFNANLADKLLVLVNGQAVYSPLYAGVLWNVQDYPLEDIDRIEVISGPGGTLWGANAVNGVINITTKSARDTPGLYLEQADGGVLQEQTEVRYGGTLAPEVYYRIYGEHTQDGSDVFGNGASAQDSLRMSRTGFRIDSTAASQNLLTVQGDYYSGTQVLGAAGEGRLSGGNLLGRWTRTLADNSDLSLQLYCDETYLAEPPPAVPGSPPFSTGFPAAALTDELRTYDLDFQRHFRVGGVNDVIAGLGYRFSEERDRDLNIIRFSPEGVNQDLYSGFVQDEIALPSNFALTLGTKLEHNDYTGIEVEPNARLQWNFAPRQMLWAAVSRAVRTPSRYDRDLQVVTGLENAPAPLQFPTLFLAGSDNFVSESELAYELGYRAQLGPKLSASVSAFYNDYNDIRSTSATPTTPTYIFALPIVFGNNLEGRTYGAEVSANYQLLDWWRLHAGYDLLRERVFPKPGQTDATGGLNETADPRNQYFLRSAMDLPDRLTLDLAYRWIDSLILDSSPTNGPVAGTVPSYFEVDARIGWQATKSLELSLVGRNLLHPHHVEYGYPGSSREEIPREAYVKAEWRY